MSDESLAAVVEKLSQGDNTAAETIFRAYEPYLRQVVRRQLDADLQAKFDSVDIIQSVWSDLLHGFREAAWSFEDAAHLKAFLVTATRHRFIDRARRHRTAVKKEETENGSLAEAITSPLPTPSQIVQAEDLWECMLAECRPAHRELLQLKRDGLSVAEIASRTGLHEDSIRRILRDLACRIATGK